MYVWILQRNTNLLVERNTRRKSDLFFESGALISKYSSCLKALYHGSAILGESAEGTKSTCEIIASPYIDTGILTSRSNRNAARSPAF